MQLGRFKRAVISSVSGLHLQSADGYFKIRGICNSNLSALLYYYNSYFSHAFALKRAVGSQNAILSFYGAAASGM